MRDAQAPHGVPRGFNGLEGESSQKQDVAIGHHLVDGHARLLDGLSLGRRAHHGASRLGPKPCGSSHVVRVPVGENYGFYRGSALIFPKPEALLHFGVGAVARVYERRSVSARY